MLKQAVNNRSKKLLNSCELPCSMVSFRRSSHEIKKIQSFQKNHINTRENSAIKQLQFFQSTFKTFGNQLQEKQQDYNARLKGLVYKNETLRQNESQQKQRTIRFSDFKKKQAQGKRFSAHIEPNQTKNNLHLCQNHPKRMAKFYINCNQKERLQKQQTQYYCLQCSINLSQMNFNIYKINTSNQIQDHFQATLCKLIVLKNKINNREEQIKKQANLQSIDQLIRQTQQKYQHLFQLLQKIKNQQLISLQVLKIKIFDQISEQQSKLEIIRRRVSYLMKDFEKFVKCQDKGFSMEKKWKKIYDESMVKIKYQLHNLCQIPPFQPPKMPKNLKLPQIYNKLENLFNETVHELSFEAQQINQTSEQSSKIQQKASNLTKYLYNQNQLNSRSSNQENVVSGIQFVLSQSNSFYDQQNVMINI